MKHFSILVVVLLSINSCDCLQEQKGIVLDRQSMQPINNVSLGKYEKEDSSNPYSRRDYTDSNGRFDYRSMSGGITRCPSLVLYFNKAGYKPIKVDFSSRAYNDTVYLDKTN